MSDYKGDRKHNYTARNRPEGGGYSRWARQSVTH